MTDLNALKSANATRWSRAKTTRNFGLVAKHLVEAKARYQTVEKLTGVPWYFIAVAHEREASQRWDAQLGQGDPLSSISVHVPKGRGPFRNWEDGAVDALVNCAPWAARNRDWSIGGTLTMLEQYNGLGYASRGRPSPYIWSGTDQYVSGKYVRDGVYDAATVDVQPGCAGLLMAMRAIDPTITFTGAVITPPTKPAVPVPSPSVTNPAKGSIGAWIASIFSAIFKRK